MKNAQGASVWSKRLGREIFIAADTAEPVDELLRTGVGTRMLVPDWDAKPASVTNELSVEQAS